MESGMVVLIELTAAILVSGFLPVLEGAFKITTEISWIELSDLNHPLLKRMTIEAPGTYHHSLIVATLAENAAEAIHANATMVRVCSYFHDIGKLEDPHYFIENQGENINPHDKLTAQMSARKIISHVKDGVTMAHRQGLNPRIVDIIREHHGDSLMYFFYRKAQDARNKQLQEVEKGLRNMEDVVEVDEKDFRYPGPRPTSRESAIISLADALESASRTLPDREVETIQNLVTKIVQGRLRDNQLDHADLTLRELSIICESFTNNLKSILHARVPYPKEIDIAMDDDPEWQGGIFFDKPAANTNARAGEGREKDAPAPLDHRNAEEGDSAKVARNPPKEI